VTPKELTELAKVCQRHGIRELKLGDQVYIKLDSYSPQDTGKKSKSGPTPDVVPTEELTPEQIMFWSAGDEPA
jgi:hypothetical protein